MYASTSISAGMKGASKAMAAMNNQMELARQIKVMKEFHKQSTQLDMTENGDQKLERWKTEGSIDGLNLQVWTGNHYDNGSTWWWWCYMVMADYGYSIEHILMVDIIPSLALLCVKQ